MHWDPERFGIKPESVTFQSESGNALHGWYIRSTQKQSKGAVVYFHGNAENLSSHYLTLAWLPSQGYDYLIFEYSGYGESQGTPEPETTVRDGIAAIRWVTQKNPGRPLAVYAQSLGGAIALRAVHDAGKPDAIKVVIVDSTFHSYQAIGRKVLAGIWLTWPFQWLSWVLLSDGYAPEGVIEKLSPTPLIVIHGDADNVVDYSLGQKVYDLAKPPKAFWKVPGGRHTDALWKHNGIYRQKFLEALALYLK